MTAKTRDKLSSSATSPDTYRQVFVAGEWLRANSEDCSRLSRKAALRKCRDETDLTLTAYRFGQIAKGLGITFEDGRGKATLASTVRDLRDQVAILTDRVSALEDAATSPEAS